MIDDSDNCSHVSESPPPPLSPTLSFKDDFNDDNDHTLLWVGSPLSEVCFGPSAAPILSPLKSSPTHCVTFKPDIKVGVVPVSTPPIFKDTWDDNHVRMPCSSQCLYPIEHSKLTKKWDLITKALCKPINDMLQFEEAILSYNTRFSGKWKFRLVHCYFTDFVDEDERRHFFSSTLPGIIDLALALPRVVTHAVPLLRKQQVYSLTLSQHQIACLLANAFLCTFPRRNTNAPRSEYSKFPSINFNTLFCSFPNTKRKLNKLRCILHYFDRVLSKMPTGTLTFSRKVATNLPNWDKCTQQFSKLHVSSQGTIESDGHGMLQVDFANKYIGGGVLGHGCVQEEIRFLICPELIVSRLFTEELDNNESLLMIGAEQYSTYKGYADSFEWNGTFIDQTLSDEWGRKQVHIVAIDALIFRSKGTQFQHRLMQRELNKAYSGYMGIDNKTPCDKLMAVATGNWGCGAFGGDVVLKSILQWMACSVTGRDMVYYTFDKTGLLTDLQLFHELVRSKELTVGDVWRLLNAYHTEIISERKRTTLLRYMTLKSNQK